MNFKDNKIEGNVIITRDLTLGGGLVANGDSIFSKDLKVKGWLDAPNIRGACKGLFLSYEHLKSVYPSPKDGWWAMVGTAIPADVYVEVDGEWSATGDKVSDINVELHDYLTKEEASTLYGEKIEDLYSIIEEGNTIHVDSIRFTVTSTGVTFNFSYKDSTGQIQRKELSLPGASATTPGIFTPALYNSIQNLISQGDSLNSKAITELKEEIANLEPMSYLPYTRVESVAEESIEMASVSAEGEVIFNTTSSTFIYKVITKGVLDKVNYYNNWAGGDVYGEHSSLGKIPRTDALYYNGKTIYRGSTDGLELVIESGTEVDASKFATAEQGAKADTAIQHVGVESYSWSKGEQIYNGTYLNAQRVPDENGNYVAVNIEAKIIEVGDAAADNDGLVSAYQLRGLLEALSTGLNERITALDQKITAIQSGNTTEGIDSLDEVKSFLEGMQDTDVLQDKLIEAGAMDEATVTNIATEIVEEKLQNIDGEITSSYDEDEGKLTLS